MKTLFINLKNLIPYLTLITIYFFFVNYVARNNIEKPNKNNERIENKDLSPKNKSIESQNYKRVIIPVIPYKY